MTNNQSIFDRLGVRKIINAKGTATRVSGGIMDPEVAEAMREATQACVDMTELQARASEIIAGVTGAQAGLVTSGGAAAVMLGTAACVTGTDPGLINRLPDTKGLRDEVVIVRSQRNFYDHAVRAVGVRLVEVGIADRYSGPGVRDAEAWELADAIGERTACIFYVAQPQSQPDLSSVVEVAREAGVPVVVDAANQLPPVSNLRRYIAEGADLVAFSGGKAIHGPQGTGILCGRRDLIAAAALHNLDHDIFFEQWQPPPSFIDKSTVRGLPQHGIGRACKVGKEQVVGLLVALQRFDDEWVERRHQASRAIVESIEKQLPSDLPVRLVRFDAQPSGEARLRIELDERAPCTAMQLVLALQAGEPSIQVDPVAVSDNAIVIVPTALTEDAPEQIVARLVDELQS